MDLPVGAAIDDAVSRVFEPIQLTGESVLDTSLLFAMIVYGFVALFLKEAIDWLTSRIARRRLQLEQESITEPAPPVA